MLNITSIENALYAWVHGISNITTIFARPNAPRPTASYVLINILQSTPKSIAEHQETLLIDDSIDVDYSTVEELFVTINVYYDDAYQIATKLKDSLGRVTIQDELYAAGLGYNNTSEVREISEEINKKFEQRAQFDCFFFVRSIDEENIETIRKIEIENELDGTTKVVTHPDD